jgi:AcrR family transcriptional regulator
MVRAVPRAHPKAAYHHGALRDALIEASLTLIARDGIAGLNFREVARLAGVTHGAPYHHFPDKAALLRAIAEDGFARLAAQLTEVRARAADPAVALEACVLAYVKFAQDHPGHFRAMFYKPAEDPGSEASVDRTGEAAFQIVVDAIADCQRAGVAPPGPAMTLALLIWAAAHGLAALWLDGPLVKRAAALRSKPELLARRVAQTLRVLLATGAHAAE